MVNSLTHTFKIARLSLALSLALLASLLTPAAAAAPIIGAPSSCTVSENTVRTCKFACLEGATVTVKGTNGNEWFDQTFTASCGGAHASCESDPGESCKASDTAGQAGEGSCNMEADGEGSATCSSSGGKAPDCLDNLVDCVCPDAVCGKIGWIEETIKKAGVTGRNGGLRPNPT